METRAKPASFEPELNLNQILNAAGDILLGKPEAIRLALTCLIAGGHLLIEDLPGVGKTTLAHLLARLLGLDYQRIQFTSDLLPADVIGVSIYDRDEARFHFHPGPVFAQLVLADEINRASPKTQSALLEAMEERQITVDAETHKLPEPFCVIATQNPAHQVGTFPLPESQLDRFLMRISLGYPDRASERRLLAESRRGDRFVQGLSPRAGLSLLRAARAWALIDGRYQVVPDDVQAVLVPVVAHRLRPAAGLDDGEQTARQLLEAVDIP